MTQVPENILLLQARPPGDPMLVHEKKCFARRLGTEADRISVHNFTEADFPERGPDEYDLLLVGGSGSFSLVEGGFHWEEALLSMMRTVVDLEIPMFGSCFGFQALAKAFDGELSHHPDCSELGTFEIHLTEFGRRDPLFGELPETFNAQLGHQDFVKEAPEGFTRLARSDRCRVQAIRHESAPIVATQFHPELTEEENMERFNRYIEDYKRPDETIDEARQRARQIHAPSPEANALLGRFLETHFVDKAS